LSGRVESRAFIRGRLSSGAMIQAEVTLTIVAGGVGVSVSPNPLVSRGTITWRTEKPGPIRARLFDVQGRLVRTLYENSEAAAGYHDVELDREGPGGTRLAAGVYFLRVETRGGEQIRRVAVVK
ncbi:MAG TPA: T9SS type A sorting domain-containing protein, partial [Candidatus Eisenbacteria bacterium]|nr:T9SS type A sorting domain-containing protein [Candidatus Eisenbacteria bacterium]